MSGKLALREMFLTADLLVDVTRRCEQAKRRLTPDATWRQYLAYERLAEQQQILASKVLAQHRLANGDAFK